MLAEEETTEAAMRLLWRWVALYGVPRALYTDHKNVYVTDREPTLEEELAGEPALTAFGKACRKLGIQSRGIGVTSVPLAWKLPGRRTPERARSSCALVWLVTER